MNADPRLWITAAVYFQMVFAATAGPLANPFRAVEDNLATYTLVKNSPRVFQLIPAAPKSAQIPAAFADDTELGPMIGQMILIGFPGGVRDNTWRFKVSELIRKEKIGGVVLFPGAFVDPGRTKELISSMYPAGGILHPFICVDQPGSSTQRLPFTSSFAGPPMTSAGLSKARPLRLKSVEELASVGINCNFGSALDLALDPKDLASREKDSSRKVTANAGLVTDAHLEADAPAAAKRFRRHGSARDGAREVELAPFGPIAPGELTDMIVVGHATHPGISDGTRPASLSRTAVTDVLRGQHNYRGLVVTDDLDARAIRSRYGLEEAAVMAIEAGSDMMIVANTKTPDPFVADRIIGAVMRAIAAGRLSRNNIEQSYQRIMKAKASLSERQGYVE